LLEKLSNTAPDNQHFKKIVETSVDGILVLDGNGVVLYANPSASVLLEIPAESLPGIEIGIPAAGRDPVELTIMRPGGDRAIVEMRVREIAWDGGQCLLAGLRDITALRAAQDELRRKSEELEEYFNSSLDLFCIADTDGYFRKLNSQWEEVLGYSNEELEDSRFLDLVHPDDLEATLGAIDTLKKQEELLSFINRYRREDGSYRWLEWKSLPKGNKIIAAARDITQRVEAEQEKEKLEARLRQSQKMESIGRLAGGIAHDFNNLLTVIGGFAEIILETVPEEGTVGEAALEINRAAESAAAMTRQLLAFSRKQIIAPRVMDLNEFIRESEEVLQRLIGEDVELVFFPDENLGWVWLDPNQLDQVLVNLAVNARDAMPGGGKLTFETQNLQVEHEKAFLRDDDIKGDFVLLAVSDTGHGIPEEIKKEIFEPFFTTKEKGSGTGLGLATVYGIVKQNNGYINVYSEPEQGTTVKIYLPRIEAEAALLELEEEEDSTVRGGNETIMLVEDQEMLGDLAERILVSGGYKVLSFRDGEDALENMEDLGEEADLLLTDVVLPGMSGKELYEKMRETRPNLKVLFMSGYTEDTISHHGVLQEGLNFLQKPFRTSELRKKVRKVLDETSG